MGNIRKREFCSRWSRIAKCYHKCNIVTLGLLATLGCNPVAVVTTLVCDVVNVLLVCITLYLCVVWSM